MKIIFVVLGFACMFLPVEGQTQQFSVGQSGNRNKVMGGNTIDQTSTRHETSVTLQKPGFGVGPHPLVHNVNPLGNGIGHLGANFGAFGGVHPGILPGPHGNGLIHPGSRSPNGPTYQGPSRQRCYENRAYYEHGETLPSENFCQRCICNKGVKHCGQVICVNLVHAPRGCTLSLQHGNCCKTVSCPHRPAYELVSRGPINYQPVYGK